MDEAVSHVQCIQTHNAIFLHSCLECQFTRTELHMVPTGLKALLDIEMKNKVIHGSTHSLGIINVYTYYMDNLREMDMLPGKLSNNISILTLILIFFSAERFMRFYCKQRDVHHCMSPLLSVFVCVCMCVRVCECV